ncbi:twin-arginine translocase subunit TatC [Propionicimonas sp.]|uniref:twin-arginine translocase subunit TatC n=1 Tax=Propionicimonas sp. TaxID=1955623 RepID=UPI0039E6558F
MAEGKRRRFAWLRPPEAGPGGTMSLGDHLRELRYRLIVSAVAIIVTSLLAAIWYDQLYQVMLRPYLLAVQMLAESNPNLDPTTVITGVATPLILAMKVCVVAGIVLSSPVWVYQIWAFIVPALLAKEKRYALGFIGAAVPLFLLGVLIGYYIMPQGISVLLAFTPSSVPVTNLVDVEDFLTLTLQLMVVFGLGFLIPVLVVGLNLVGVLKADQLKKVRTYVVFGIFVFGAAATPSTDPFSMLALAIPMTVLYLIAEVICRVHDRRKAKADLVVAGT